MHPQLDTVSRRGHGQKPAPHSSGSAGQVGGRLRSCPGDWSPSILCSLPYRPFHQTTFTFLFSKIKLHHFWNICVSGM